MTAPARRVRLEIGRLCLHGVPAVSRRRFERAFAASIEGALAGLDPGELRAGGTALHEAALRLPAGATPEALAGALASALAAAIRGREP